MWLIAPSTSSASAPEPADSTSESSWLWEALASSAALSGKPTASPSWRRAARRKAWLARLCGRICDPSTAARGVESWIASLRATRASRSASPADAVDRMILATCGPTSLASLTRRHRPSSFSRTCPATSIWGSVRLPESLKEWATRSRRACSARERSARRIVGFGCSYSQWPTAKASLGGADPVGGGDNRGAANLKRAVLEWTTPQAHDVTGGHLTRGGLRSSEMLLPGQAKMWPTPTQRDSKGKSQRGEAAPMDALANMAECSRSFRPDPATSMPGDESSKQTRRLNLRFVEWLMGWPIGWTDCERPATASSAYKRRMRSALSGLCCEMRRDGSNEAT